MNWFSDLWEDTGGKIILILAIAVVIGLMAAVAVGVKDCAAPYILVSAGEATNHIGDKAQMVLTVDKFVTDKTELEFFIFMPVTTGKTTMMVPIPIFDRYDVYSTKEGIFLAVDHGDKVSGKQTFYGHLKESHGNIALETQ